VCLLWSRLVVASSTFGCQEVLYPDVNATRPGAGIDKPQKYIPGEGNEIIVDELARESRRNLFIDVAGNDPLQDAPHTEETKVTGSFKVFRGLCSWPRWNGRRSRDRLHYSSQLCPGAVPVNQFLAHTPTGGPVNSFHSLVLLSFEFVSPRTTGMAGWMDDEQKQLSGSLSD
jgi:hypothetical protein